MVTQSQWPGSTVSSSGVTSTSGAPLHSAITWQNNDYVQFVAGGTVTFGMVGSGSWADSNVLVTGVNHNLQARSLNAGNYLDTSRVGGANVRLALTQAAPPNWPVEIVTPIDQPLPVLYHDLMNTYQMVVACPVVTGSDSAEVNDFTVDMVGIGPPYVPAYSISPAGQQPTAVPITAIWQYRPGSDSEAPNTQTHYHVKIFRKDDIGIGFNIDTSPAFYDSGPVASAATSHDCGVLPDDYYVIFPRVAATQRGVVHWARWEGGNFRQFIVGVPPVPTAEMVKYWDGTTWVEGPLMFFNGTDWVEGLSVMTWNGTAWVDTNNFMMMRNPTAI